MVSAEVVKIVAENTERIEREIQYIYKEWQNLKLKNFGYTWGFHSRCKDVTVRSVMRFKWNIEFVTVNESLGCEFIFPTRWLSNENWKNEAMLGITAETNIVLIDKLSE